MREADATWVIPTEDEWYKAAYHKSGGVTGDYFDYPTSNDGLPGFVNNSGNLYPDGAPFTEGGIDPGNYATSGPGVTIEGIGSPYFRTNVGEWENSGSPYGTLDQGGNIKEWNETAFGQFRGTRGGYYLASEETMHAQVGGGTTTSGGGSAILGFRIAQVFSECGNGIVEFGEPCDDGNEDETDFCLSTCERGIPAVSEWGMVTMVLLGLTAGTLVFAKRKCQMA